MGRMEALVEAVFFFHGQKSEVRGSAYLGYYTDAEEKLVISKVNCVNKRYSWKPHTVICAISKSHL